MARGRVKLARIINESKRRATLKKRKLALIKRLQALCVLCNVEACMMIFDGRDDQPTDDSVVWPSRQEAATMVSKFTSTPDQRKNIKAVTCEKYLETMLLKEKKMLQELKKKNDEMEMKEILHKLHNVPDSIQPMHGKLTRAYFYIEDLIQKIDGNKISSQDNDNVS